MEQIFTWSHDSTSLSGIGLDLLLVSLKVEKEEETSSDSFQHYIKKSKWDVKPMLEIDSRFPYPFHYGYGTCAHLWQFVPCYAWNKVSMAELHGSVLWLSDNNSLNDDHYATHGGQWITGYTWGLKSDIGFSSSKFSHEITSICEVNFSNGGLIVLSWYWIIAEKFSRHMSKLLVV